MTKAIVLSATKGQGLLPQTANRPLCLLPVIGERTVLDVQLDALAKHGVNDVAVVVGDGADRVEAHLALRREPAQQIRALYDPSHAADGGLSSCGLARNEMVEDFLLLDGATVFEPNVLARLLAHGKAPLTLAVNEKSEYAERDTKVSVERGRLRAVSKSLEGARVTGESVGMMLFRGCGVKAFRSALDAAAREGEPSASSYVPIIDALAAELQVEAVSIIGNWWGALETPDDLALVRLGLEQLEKLEADGTYGQPGYVRIRR